MAEPTKSLVERRTVLRTSQNSSMFNGFKPLPENPAEDPKGIANLEDSISITTTHIADDVMRVGKLFFPTSEDPSKLNSLEKVKNVLNTPGSKFVLNQLMQAQYENTVALENAANNTLNGDLAGAGANLKELFRVDAGNVIDPAVNIARTFVQVPLAGTGIHLNWNSNKYLQGANEKEGIHKAKEKRTLFVKNIDEEGGYTGAFNGTKLKIQTDLDLPIVNTYLQGSEEQEGIHKAKSGRKLEEESPQNLNYTPGENTYIQKPNNIIGPEKLAPGKEKFVDENLNPIKDSVYNTTGSTNSYFDENNQLRDKSKKEPNARISLKRKIVDPNHSKGTVDPIHSKGFTLVENEDFIPFYFTSIIPGEKTNEVLQFRAFLNTFSDSYNGEINGTRYVGRADEFYTYQGFKRTISFSFMVAAMSEVDLIPIYEKLNRLAGLTAPSYGGLGNSFMRGTLTSVNVGDYLKNQKGYITSIRFSWDKEHPWEILKDIKQVPHILTVDVEFTPIFEQNVTYQSSFFAN